MSRFGKLNRPRRTDSTSEGCRWLFHCSPEGKRNAKDFVTEAVSKSYPIMISVKYELEHRKHELKNWVLSINLDLVIDAIERAIVDIRIYDMADRMVQHCKN